MPVKEIDCQSVLRRFTAPDKYFHGLYGIDVYQNCGFACRYCDSSFDSMIYICRNAVEILSEEIADLPRGRVIIGSVHDPYQSVEESFGLVRQVIDLLIRNGFAVHVLTKSPLVLRDVDLLRRSEQSLVTISMMSLDDVINQRFEPLVPSAIDRLQTLKQLVDAEVNAGVAIFPILPFLVEEGLPELVHKVKMFHGKYVIYKHLELKGALKDQYIQIIQEFYPELVHKYRNLYDEGFSPSDEYIHELALQMNTICRAEKIACSIPIYS
jgi:DNA repair photolyase